MYVEAGATQRLPINLAGWLLVRELHMNALDAPESHRTRVRVPSQACEGEESEEAGRGRNADVETDVKETVGGGGVGADAEASPVARSVLDRHHDALQLKGGIVIEGEPRAIPL